MTISMKKTRAFFVDTSAHFALANERDVDHQRAKACLKQLAEESATLISSNFILAESYTLMLKKDDQLLLMKLRRKVDLRIEPHPFLIEEFSADNPFVKTIIETGEEIFDN